MQPGWKYGVPQYALPYLVALLLDGLHALVLLLLLPPAHRCMAIISHPVPLIRFTGNTPRRAIHRNRKETKQHVAQ
jgi:hypothetical protein